MPEYISERTLVEYELLLTSHILQDDEIVYVHIFKRIIWHNYNCLFLFLRNINFSKIKKSRAAFEHRVAQTTCIVRDYLEYIKYERGLISLIRNRTKPEQADISSKIVIVISSRMKPLYSQALAKFPSETRFWDEFIKFLQQFQFNADISPTYARMLQVNITNIVRLNNS